MIRRAGLARIVVVVLAASLTSPTVGRSQEAAGARCADASAPRADLGITGIACRCSEERDGDSRSWSFRTEPEILGVRGGGASAGRLQPGDRIARIDGHLITTPAGGRAWSDVSPGDTVRLRVRRDGRVLAVTIVAEASCPETGRVSARPQTRSPRLPRLHPKGWLGMGLRCDCSVDTSGGEPRWTFDASPTVVAVDPESPAAAAGLRPGDVLVRIDGTRLDTAEGGAAFSAVSPGQVVRLTVERSGTPVDLVLTAGTRDGSDAPRREGVR